MNVVTVTNALQGLNPHGGANPHGNCTTCAIDAANALIGGAAPMGQSAPGESPIASPAPAGVVNQFPLGAGGGMAVWGWLTLHAPAGVYVFETEDHSYNIVKHQGIYLVDANAQEFRQLNAPADAIVFSPVFNNDYNYLDPEPEDTGDQLSAHYWGALHGNWH